MSITKTKSGSKFVLPELPYDRKALAPYISEETFEYHYGKHHAAYVNNLNKLVDGSPLVEASLEDIVVKSTGGVFNNAAQHWNHTFFWDCMHPNGGGEPTGALLKAIEKNFTNYATFKEKFSQAATGLFGAGWAWLSYSPQSGLEILPLSNADTPLKTGKKPLLTLDVWEHAYYIDYRNQRPKFVEGFWDVVNWDFVAKNLQAASASAN